MTQLNYKFYLFCRPYLLFLEKESLLELNFGKSEELLDILEIKTEDIFFIDNLKIITQKEFSINLICFECSTNEFVCQYDLVGENFEIFNTKIIFLIDGIIINRTKPLINPKFQEIVDLYQKERVSYLRNSKLKNLLK